MNDIHRDLTPVRSTSAAPISPRAYNLVLAGLIFVGFLVMWLGVRLVSSMGFLTWLATGANFITFLVGSIGGTIGGIVLMGSAVKRQSVAASLLGYALFVCAFGLMCAIVVMNYDLPTINAAFLATAGITLVFGAAGLAFPRLFQRIFGVAFVALIGLIVVELVMSLLGMDQTWLDGAFVLVFCAFIGYDMHQAASVEPTLPNAVFNACNLFLDIMNVFLRLLDIFDRR